jgi:hypothetical protein
MTHGFLHIAYVKRSALHRGRDDLSPRVNWGRVIAQGVSSRLPTAAVRVRAQFRLCDISGGRSDTGAGFFRVLRFPLPIHIPPTAPHSSSITRGLYNRPISGRRTEWTQSHRTPKNLKKKRVNWA